MIRREDETGTSGIGLVVEGVEFSDGHVVIRWLTSPCSTAVYEDMKTFLAIHVHSHPGNKTEIEWEDGQVWSLEDEPFPDFDT